LIARVVAFCAGHRRIVLAGAALAALAGVSGGEALRRDVLPDLSSPQITLVAEWMGHPATEVARGVGQVLTEALAGLPGSTSARASSMADMAYVDIAFASARDLPARRQEIVERVAAIRSRLPPNVRVHVGPAASSTGWVFEYALIDPARSLTPLDLRRLQEDTIGPALASIPGVAEVATVGGSVEELLVEGQQERLAAHRIAFGDLAMTVRDLVEARPDLGAAELGAARLPGSRAVTVADVARVRTAIDAMPNGLADLGGLWPAVGGIVVAARDGDLATIVTRVRERLEHERTRLPSGVKLVTVYDRLDLTSRVYRTLGIALAEEIGVVVLVILLFLAHARSALVPLVTLPVVLLLTAGAMWLLGVPATIMSLGGIGIALGMAVDADVVSLEACHRRLESLNGEGTDADRHGALLAAAGAFAPAVLTSLLIAALSFVPVFAFSGETGRLLTPLALTKTLVVAAAALVTVTLAPALRDLLLRGRVTPELANPLVRLPLRVYRPIVQFALARPVLTLATAGLALASCLPIVHRLGAEFLPQVDEGDLLFMPTTRPGIAPHIAAAEMRRQNQKIAGFGEVATVLGKVGRADTATDPAPFSMIETTIRLLPREQWPKRARQRWYSGWAPSPLRRVLGLVWPEETPATTAELVEAMDRATRLPGWEPAWTAPVRTRLDMMSTGVRTPVGIRVVAADPARLEVLGTELRALALQLPETRSATFESMGGESRLTFEPDAEALALHRVNPALARSTAQLLLSGGQVGDVARGARRIRVRVIPETGVRGPADELREATVRGAGAADGGPGEEQLVALGLLGRPRYASEPAVLRTERGELVAHVYVDFAQGTNLSRYIETLKRQVDDARAAGVLALERGERIEWTGQYELLLAGQRRLGWIVPAVLVSMALLLFLQFRSVVECLIILASVPLALVGSVWTLYLLGYALSPPVWVGLLSTVGLAMQTGVVMVVYIDSAFHRRVREGRLLTRDDIVDAHAEGTIHRLRPKLMTIVTMAAGLAPLLWVQGPGAEVMRRVAAPMVGGLASSTFLTLEVLPVVYTLWRAAQLRRATRDGIPIEQVVGRSPRWARS
jgi:Cu(I)/Ag(I) efflux system membrane protein CusA/SilA